MKNCTNGQNFGSLDRPVLVYRFFEPPIPLPNAVHVRTGRTVSPAYSSTTHAPFLSRATSRLRMDFSAATRCLSAHSAQRAQRSAKLRHTGRLFGSPLTLAIALQSAAYFKNCSQGDIANVPLSFGGTVTRPEEILGGSFRPALGGWGAGARRSRAGALSFQVGFSPVKRQSCRRV